MSGKAGKVAEDRTEALVILNAEAMDDALPALQRAATVTQVLRPRLAIVSTEAATDSLAQIEGVVGVFTNEVPESAKRPLTPPELLFVDAWDARRRPKPDRPGDHLPWDAPGFQPPDPPR